MERGSSAELDGDNKLVTGYGWGPNGLMSVTDYTSSAPDVYMTTLDGVGNVAGLVNSSSGAMEASYRFDPYGKLLSATGPCGGRLLDVVGQGITDAKLTRFTF